MNTVIYYPHAYPPLDWLKTAILCWDTIYTLSGDHLPDGGHDRGLYNFIWALQDAAKIKTQDILDHVRARDIGSLPEVQEQFKRWAAERKDMLKLKDYEESDFLFWDNFISRGKFQSESPFLSFLHEQGLAREETQPYTRQIPRWEAERKARGNIEAPYIPPQPEPGSDHEKYRRLTKEAVEKKRINDHEGAVALEAEAEKIRLRNLVTVTGQSTIVYMAKDIALHYLSLCATKAALDGKRDLVAYSEEFTDSVFHTTSALRGEVALTVLQAYLPKDFAQLTPEQLAEFRSEFATQRLQYQKAIQSIVEEFSGVASEGQLDKLRGRIVDLAKERVEKTQVTYSRAKMDLVIKSFGIALTPPAVATSIASMLGIGLFAPAGIAAALSLFAASKIIEWDKARSDRAESPWSYVLDAAKI